MHLVRAFSLVAEELLVFLLEQVTLESLASRKETPRSRRLGIGGLVVDVVRVEDARARGADGVACAVV
jgi:hypothetical protein